MKLYKALEQIFRFRILSNAEIPAYIKKLSIAGKVDQPKVNAILTELLVRVGQLEEAQGVDISSLEDRLLTLEKENQDLANRLADTELKVNYPAPTSDSLSWNDLRAKAKELGVFKPGLKRAELESLIAAKK